MVADQTEELLALASVGLLSVSEEADLDRYVGSSSVLKEQAKALKDTAALLAYLAAPYLPAPGLKQVILREIDRRMRISGI